jgi:pseudouridine-5'-phosphate glycosidase
VTNASMLSLIDFSDEVQHALAHKQPIVALESTIIAQNPNYPTNVERAFHAQAIVRSHGCVPATMGIVAGRLKIGLSEADIHQFGQHSAPKISRRDFVASLALKRDGATTVTTTMMLAGLVGIKVFATGGIGGVHRGVEDSMDISSDLEELTRHNICVVCSGPKAILDQKRTLEYLETKGVPVLGYQTDELPGFYTRTTGLKVDYRIDDLKSVADMLKLNDQLGYQSGILLCNPVPEAYAMSQAQIDSAIEKALLKAKEQNIHGKQLTPFLLGVVYEETQGKNRITNRELVYDNVRVASLLASQLK